MKIALFAVAAVALAQLTACGSDKVKADYLALETEEAELFTKNFEKADDAGCSKVDKAHAKWLSDNKDRIEKIDAAWKKLDQGERDAYFKSHPDEVKKNFAIKMQITLTCGMAPKRDEATASR